MYSIGYHKIRVSPGNPGSIIPVILPFVRFTILPDSLCWIKCTIEKVSKEEGHLVGNALIIRKVEIIKFRWKNGRKNWCPGESKKSI